MRFDFDTRDPQAVASHLPELEDLLVSKLTEHEQLTATIEELRQLITIGSGLSRAGGRVAISESLGVRRRRASPAQDRAVHALKLASEALAGTAVGPTSLYRYMVENGMDVPRDPTVLGTNLWDAWQAGRIRRAPNGVYLPLDHTGRTEVDYPLTDYYYAAEQGLPLPTKPSGTYRPQPLVGRTRRR
jgi:hypothetical protein